MTKDQIYELVTSLLNGIQIEEGLFESFLDVAQMNVEGLRPWVYLRGEDSTQTAGASDGFLTSKTLASDFLKWYDDDSSVVLTDGNYNSILHYRQIPIAQRFAYKNTNNVFYVDYSQNKFYLCGTITQSYTIHQNYIKSVPLVSSDNAWVFPSRFHKILALYVAVYWKEGIDYDIISNSQANAQAGQAAAIYDVMSRWDSDIQNSMTKGLDPFDTDSSSGQQAGRLSTF